MTDKHLFSITALFDTPDEVIHAAHETSQAGYTRYDVNTPYPVHGMDKAMKLKPTRLGVFSLAFGILGAVSAVLFMSWVSLVDYPLIIGGKPFWSWPAFVPVAFEVTVLLVAVLTVVTMIVLFFKFPNNSHPLHDTPYMKRVSSDKFGISIQADDPKFNERDVTAFLKKVGGKEIAPVYFDAEEFITPRRLFEPKFLAILAATALVVSGATHVIFNQIMFMEPFSWMSTQVKLKPQRSSELFEDGIGMQRPVAGTVARGFIPYAFAGKPDLAGKNLVNPLPMTKEVIERGKSKYLTSCSPCHGNFGAGDSRLRGQFPNPPTLHSDKVRTWPDGNLYHVMTEGQNVMPSYAAQISRDDRWAVVNYIRVMQRAHNAKESDLK
jgi:mono/diheme cytochrome c family protein